jgi:hypothetical protein
MLYIDVFGIHYNYNKLKNEIAERVQNEQELML